MGVQIKEAFIFSMMTIREDLIRSTLQETCDELKVYPSKIVRNSKGVSIYFFKPDKGFDMFKIVNNLKMALKISTVMINRAKFKVDGEPMYITNFANYAFRRVSEKDALLKRLEEDIDMFNSHAKAQIESSDYDTIDGRKADVAAIKHERKLKKNEGVIVPETGGQIQFDFSAFS